MEREKRKGMEAPDMASVVKKEEEEDEQGREQEEEEEDLRKVAVESDVLAVALAEGVAII